MSLIESIATLLPFITILIFDFKGDFIDVASRLGKDIWNHYSATEGFRIGIGPPIKCIKEVSWINQLTKLFAAHCNLKFSEATLASVIRITFNLLNYPMTGSIVWPSLPLIEEMLKTLPWYLVARKEEYWRTALHKIEYINLTSGDLFNVDTGFDVDEHLVKPRKCAVIDCTCLSPLLSEILVNLICLHLLFLRITLRLTSGKTNIALVIDEVDPLMSYEACKKYPEGYSFLGRYVKQIREFGGFGAFGVSFLGNCDRFITANITNTIFMNQSDPDSVREAAQVLLQPDSMPLISSLQTGQGIFKESMGPVNYGMLIKTDYVEPSTMSRPDKFDIPPFTKARLIDDIPGFREKVIHFIKQSKSINLSHQTKTANPVLSKNENTLLKLMCLHEFKPLNLIFDQMHITSAGVQADILKKLIEFGYIEAETFRSESIWFRLGWLTEGGWEFNHDRSKYSSTRGDLIHTTICRNIMFLGKKRNYEEFGCEKQLKGTSGFCDAFHRIEGLGHAFEVIIGTDKNILKHARDALIKSTEPIASLTFVTALKSEHKKIEQIILSDPELVFHRNKIHFTTAAQIFKELWS